MSRIFGFKYKYPKSFLEELAKACGVKLTYYKPKFLLKDEVEVRPLGPPLGILHYMDYKIKTDANENIT